MITLSPHVFNAAFPLLFAGSYMSLRKYRDPMHCGACLHLPGCVFATKGAHDRRKFASSVAPSSAPETERAFFPYIIYRVSVVAVCVMTLIPAVFYVSSLLRNIRHGFNRCNCMHSTSCRFGVERFVPPVGYEAWTPNGSGFECPKTGAWKNGIRVTPSSARVIHLEFRDFERQKRQRKRASSGRGV